MSMPLKNLIIAIFMLMIGSGYLYMSSQLPDRSIQNVPGPAFFPMIVSGFILILSFALLGKSFLGMRKEPLLEHGLSFPRHSLAILAWFVLFLVVLPYVGFLAAGIPFFAGLMLLCERRNILYVIGGSVVIPVSLYFLFREVFNILLPAGIWS